MRPEQVKAQQARSQQIAQGGIPHEIKDLPDRLLIDTLVGHGQPLWSARELRTNPQLRLYAVKFYFDVVDAGRGDREAKARVDYCRAAWSALRREELISDDPTRQYPELVDPKEVL